MNGHAIVDGRVGRDDHRPSVDEHRDGDHARVDAALELVRVCLVVNANAKLFGGADDALQVIQHMELRLSWKAQRRTVSNVVNGARATP